MKNTLQNTRCSLRQTSNSSNCSLVNSQIQTNFNSNPIKGLSLSLQNIKNPFLETLPLKFPKNRIIKGSYNHMLTQTQEIKFKPGLRQSYMQNRQFQQKTFRKQKAKGQFYTFNQQSFDNNIQQIPQNKSLENYQNSSSLQKQSKKIFHHIIAYQTIKNPILNGDSKKQFTKKKFHNEQKRKNQSKGFQESFQWKTDLSKEKELFQNKCNTKPKNVPIFENLALSINKSKEKRQNLKTQRKIPTKEPPKTSRENNNQQTYTSIHSSKRRFLGF